MKSKDIIGKCDYCDDPIYRFQAIMHDGCAKLAETKGIDEAEQRGIRKVVEWVEPYKEEHEHLNVVDFVGIPLNEWQTFLKEITKPVKAEK